MNLASFEQELVEDIYETLICDDENKGITLYGDIGCGKTSIALGVATQLMEGWAIFYIEGINSSLSPYLTWHIGTKLHSKKKLNLGSEISFGISFQPAPISFEFGASFNTTSTDFILTPSEEAIISSMKKQTDVNRKILFIADNFEMWDIPSKQLLQKIIHPQLCLFSEYHLNVLVVSRERLSIEVPIPWKFVEVAEIPDESILHILRENGYAEQICIQDIRICAGKDLSLALMAANYYTNNGENANNFIEIMNRRCDDLSPEKQEIRKILGPLSIIDSFFSKDEAAFFLNSTPKDQYETEYLAEEYLLIAEDQMFIKGKDSFLFTSNKVKDYFRMQIAKRERYYHRRFAGFLQQRHPEDYYSRGKHLRLSLQSTDVKIIIEAWQLLLLAYFRRSAEAGCTDDIYNILDEIEVLINRLPSSSIDAQHNVLVEFIHGYQEFTMYHYQNALLHFQAITPSRLIPACLSECQRLILLCHIQLADDRQMITQSAEELYDTIEDNDTSEDEQYCRAALVLLDAYIDRSNDYQKVSILKKNLIRIIQNHLGSPEFDEFEACYNRKSALYYAAMVAYRQTEQSIQFYKKQCNRNGIYMALCNHSGNAIVSGQYPAAEKALNECLSMLNNSSGWYYPSQYKIENNIILLNFLTQEKSSKGDRKKILSAACEAITLFSNIIENQCDEVSHVVLFNYLGLSMLCQTKTWELDLANANRLLSELDEFYQYYLHDLNFASALIKGEIIKAKESLVILKSLDVPLLRHYRPILMKRQLAQENIIYNYEEKNSDPFEYHRVIQKACDHVQDNSCFFWGRGFLLSDMQFLSF